MRIPELDTLRYGHADLDWGSWGSSSWAGSDSDSHSWGNPAQFDGQEGNGPIPGGRRSMQETELADDEWDHEELGGGAAISHAGKSVVQNLHRRRLALNSTKYAHAMYIREGSYYTHKFRTIPDDTLYFNVDHLVTGQYYKFSIVPFNAAGMGQASNYSKYTRVLDAPITTVQMFSGPPCLYFVLGGTTFIAISDGSNVFYRWTNARGGTVGRCVTSDCSQMEYYYTNTGQTEVYVTAVNNVGSMLATMMVNVSYCGCTDRMDPNFWWLATYHLPDYCGSTDL